MPDVISVTPDNVETTLVGLPRLVRLALGFGARLRRGTLDVTLPDGRVMRLGGAGSGGRDDALQLWFRVQAAQRR